jgi:HEAT repeat protein
MREEVIEDVIVAFLQKQYLLGTSKIFLREHLALKQIKKGDAFEIKSDRLVKKISHRLKEAGTKEAENLLEEFFRNQLIGLEDLTQALKNKILLERLTDKFLSYTDQFFLQLDQAIEKQKFLTVALSFVKIIPELIRRDHYPEILRILETLKTHFLEKRMWALLAGQILEEIGKGTTPLLLQEKFLSGKKETRIAIVPIFASLEVGSIPPLLTILKTSEDQWVRKNACEALIQIGPVAVIHLLKELNQQETSVETTRDILRVLGEIKSHEWKSPLIEVLLRYASHENPKLKEQALYSLCQIGGSEGEQIFLSSLSDPDLDVQKRAVWCLGMIKSVKGAEKMMGMLKRISTAPSPQMDQIETQIYYAFGFAGNLSIEGRTVEQILLEILEQKGFKKWWDPFQKDLLTDSALGAICDALGRIGTKESIQTLTKLEKSIKSPLIPKVKEAIKKIVERSVISTRQQK